MHRQLHWEDYAVGWTCALPAEREIAKEMLDEEHGDLKHALGDYDRNPYTLGSIVRQYASLGALREPASALEFDRLYSKIDYNPNNDYKQIICNYKRGNMWEQYSAGRLEAQQSKSEEEVVAHYGTVASGNRAMRNTAEWVSAGLDERVTAALDERVSAALDGMLCFDMEGVSLIDSFPCLVMRKICDYADLRDSGESCKNSISSGNDVNLRDSLSVQETYSATLSDQTTNSSIQSENAPGPGTKLPCDCHSHPKMKCIHVRPQRVATRLAEEISADYQTPDHDNFMADPSHKYWTWSDEDRNWWHKDEETNAIVWAPLDFD